MNCGGVVATRIALAFLLGAAFVLRCWGLTDISGYVLDESFHVPSALSLLEYGTPLTSNWTHPPLGALILMYSIQLFGNDPFAWRIGCVVFGTLTVGMLFGVARELWGDTRIAFTSALLLTVDPSHIFYSRTTMMEIPVMFFFLAFFYFMIRHVAGGSRPMLVCAGIALGAVAATKGYYAASCMLLISYGLYHSYRMRLKYQFVALDYLCWLAVLPVFIYVLANYQFFARGGTLLEFLQMRSDALFTLRSSTIASLGNTWWTDVGGKPWEWFIKPNWYGFQIDAQRYLIDFNNMPARFLGLLSLCILGWDGLRSKSAEKLAPICLFFSVYIIFLVLNRPMLSYSALVVVPFAYLALAQVLSVAERLYSRRSTVVVTGTYIAIILWGAYWYPLATAKTVSSSLYAPVLAGAELVKY